MLWRNKIIISDSAFFLILSLSFIDTPSAYIFLNFSSMNIFEGNLWTLPVLSSLMNSKFFIGSIIPEEEWGSVYQSHLDKQVLRLRQNHLNNANSLKCNVP